MRRARSNSLQLLGRLGRKASSSSVGSVSANDDSSAAARRPRSAAATESDDDVDKLLHKYHEEEDKFLEELDAMRRESLTSQSQSQDDSQDDATLASKRGRSRHRRRLQLPSSPQTDLLGSFCHLMNYVLHLRKENRHLRKQVACLGEMRKIEQLRNDLLQASCERQLLAGSVDPSDPETSTLAERPTSDSCAAAAAAARADVAAAAGGKSRLPRPASLSPRPPLPPTAASAAAAAAGRSRAIKDGARDALATKDALMAASSYSADLSSAAEPPPPPPLPARGGGGGRLALRNYQSPIARRTIAEASDSDNSDQPVFSEVSLPSYSGEQSSAGGSSRSRRPLLARADDNASVDSASEPKESRGSFLERLGIRRRPPPSRKTSQDALSRSLCSDYLDGSRQSSARSSLRRPVSLADEGAEQRLSVRALVKKRKRKISESDSLASSEASGKPYKTIELPEITYSRPPSTVDQLRQQLSPEFVRKMENWDDKKSQLSPKSSERGKKSWLKRPKQLKLEGRDAIASYFSRSDDGPHGRQDTMVYIESKASENPVTAERVAEDERVEDIAECKQVEEQVDDDTAQCVVTPSNSDGNLNDFRCDSQPAKLLAESREDESDDVASLSASKSHSATLLEEASQLAVPSNLSRVASSMGYSESLSASYLALSEDSVFRAEEVVAEIKSGSELVNHLLSLQDKNSLLFRELHEKSKEYETITDQLCTLEREVRSLKNRYRLDAALDKLTSPGFGPRFVPISMLDDLENRMRDMDLEITRAKEGALKAETKPESFQHDARIMQAQQQLAGQKSLDQVEKLQKVNIQLLQRQMSELSMFDPAITNRLSVLPTYDAIYSFTLNLIRKLREFGGESLRKWSACASVDLELLQTQSSLLLAHSQVERQKIELAQMGLKAPKRPHSFHGHDLTEQKVFEELSFYLPFKFHGLRVAEQRRAERVEPPAFDADVYEAEFHRLFDYARKLSETVYQQPRCDTNVHYEAPQDQPAAGLCRARPPGRPLLTSLYALREGLRSDVERPLSLVESPQETPPPPRRRHCPVYQQQRLSANQSQPAQATEPPLQQRSPMPIRSQIIGNSGQVRSLAKSFDEPASPLFVRKYPVVAATRIPPPRRMVIYPDASVAAKQRGAHYDTPPECSRRATAASCSPAVGYPRAAVRPYAFSRIPQQRQQLEPLSSSSNHSEGHYETLPTPQQPLPLTSFGLLPPSTLTMDDEASLSEARKTGSLKDDAQVRRREFLYGADKAARPQSVAVVSKDRPQPPTERPVMRAQQTKKAAANLKIDAAEPKAEKTRSSWIMKFKSKKP